MVETKSGVGKEKQLQACERAIRKGLASFLPMCFAFLEIQKKELWVGKKFKSFQAYCREKWVLDYSQVSRLINAAEVVENLKSLKIPLPSNDGQCRILALLKPEEQKRVWQEVIESGEKPTARLIAKIAKLTNEKEDEEEEEEGEEFLPPKDAKKKTKKKDNFVEIFSEIATRMEDFSEEIPEMEEDEVETVREHVKNMRAVLDKIEQSLNTTLKFTPR